MTKEPEEWFRQAEYDLETAEILFRAARYFYTVFMCHLSIEKALKGLYSQEQNKAPPKTHSLLFLVESMSLKLPSELYDFVFTINRVSVPTRYPDDLYRVQNEFSRETAQEILSSSRKLLTWLKEKLRK